MNKFYISSIFFFLFYKTDEILYLLSNILNESR